MIRAARRPAASRQAGQSLVEFALVFPIMLVLLLTVADFGRLFATGVMLESSARTAAEVAAGEYLQVFAGLPGGTPMTSADYARVHRAAWSAVCEESGSLPNATPGVGGGQCGELPTVACVHDGADTECANLYNATSAPPQCPSLAGGSRPSASQAAGADSKYVEVRVCYRFSTYFNPIIPFIGGSLSPIGGDFYLEKVRVFTVADY